MTLTRRPRRAAVAAATAALLTLGACASASGGGDGDKTVVDLVGYAVPEAANEAIEAAFTKTDAGKDVDIQGSYGASGDQSRKVEADPEIADYVHFSLEGDVTRLVKAGLIAEDWKDNDHHGIVSTSVVVLVVQQGNPKNITGWEDLARDDISIVTPDPDSSGSARWNILGAYGHSLTAGQSEEQAGEFLVDVFRNVGVWAASGREATTAFDTGEYDVLVSYENEAILARQNGKTYDYIIPDTTLLIENPGAVLKDAPQAASDWLDFVVSQAGQTEFAKKGFRPITDGIDVEVEGAADPSNPFPEPAHLLTIADDFGGWDSVNEKFFSENGLIKQLRDKAAAS